MLELVGLPPRVFSNHSGRATLVTRMTARGVPDKIGMMVTGHHSTGGFLRYDRTQDLKMEAAVKVSLDPTLNYQSTLQEVSEKFFQENVVGSADKLRPLVDGVSPKEHHPISMPQKIQVICVHIDICNVNHF